MKEILPDEELQRILDGVATTVEGKLKEVSTRTLEKLKEISPDIANTLNPVIPTAQNVLRQGGRGPVRTDGRGQEGHGDQRDRQPADAQGRLPDGPAAGEADPGGQGPPVHHPLQAGGPGRLRRGACGPLQRELRRPDPGRLGGQERGQGGGPLHLHRLRVSGHGNGLREMKKPPQKGGD